MGIRKSPALSRCNARSRHEHTPARPGICNGNRRLVSVEVRMNLLRLVVASTSLVFAIACGGSYSAPSPSPTPTPSPAPAPGGASSSVSIPVGAEALGNRAYTPPDLNVAVGTTVTWTNTDRVSHTSSSNARQWDSAIIAPGGQFSTVLQTAGTFPYHCAIHPGMVGTVVVR